MLSLCSNLFVSSLALSVTFGDTSPKGRGFSRALFTIRLCTFQTFCSIMGEKEGELMSVDPIFWLLAAIGFVVLEAMTLNLVSIWFAVGSAAALLSCLATLPAGPQAPVQPAAQAAHGNERRPRPWPGGRRAHPCLRRDHRPRPAGRRGLERPLRHPRRHPRPGPELPGGRDPQHPAHRGAHPHRDRRTGGSLI